MERTAPASSKKLHGVFKGILNGVHERGDGGVLYVKGDACAYRFPNEFADEGIRDSLTTILEEHGTRQFFVVDEKDGQLHVLAYSKQHVLDEAVAWARQGSSDPGRIDEVEDARGSSEV